MKKEQPVIIIKKVAGGHGGHHGGAWKVAYADFVTAMMAFFLVMWLVSQKQEVKAAVGGYFRDPGAFDAAVAAGILARRQDRNRTRWRPHGAAARAVARGAGKTEARHGCGTDQGEAERGAEFASLRDQIELSITAEGLRIELIDKSGSSFFDSGSALLRGESVRVLGLIAEEVGTLQNDMFIEGHTDSRPYTDVQYTNWELSADRANAARRVMMRDGIKASQLKGVRGFADTQLHIATAPMDARNRRVSILVRSQVAATSEQIAATINDTLAGQPPSR